MTLLTYYSDLQALCSILDTLDEHTTIKWIYTDESLDNPDVMMKMGEEGFLRIENGSLGIGRAVNEEPMSNSIFLDRAIEKYGFFDKGTDYPENEQIKDEDPVDDGCRSCKYFYAEEWCGLEPTPVRIQTRIDTRCRYYVKKEVK